MKIIRKFYVAFILIALSHINAAFCTEQALKNSEFILPVTSLPGEKNISMLDPQPLLRGGRLQEEQDEIRALKESKEEYIQTSLASINLLEEDDGESINEDDDDDSGINSPSEFIQQSMITPMDIKPTPLQVISRKYHDLDQDIKEHVANIYESEKVKQANEIRERPGILKGRYIVLSDTKEANDRLYNDKLQHFYSLDARLPSPLEIQELEEFRMSCEAFYRKEKQKLDQELEKELYESPVARLYIEYIVSYTLSLFDVVGHEELNSCLKALGYPVNSMWL